MNEENNLNAQTQPVEQPVQPVQEPVAPVEQAPVEQAPVAPAPEAAPAQPVQQPVGVQPVGTPPVQQPPVQPQQPKGNSNIIFIAIVAVLVLLIIVVGVVLVVKNVKKDNGVPTTTTTTEAAPTEYTTKYQNTTNTVVSTTTRTYTTTTYTQTTRTTKAPTDPTPVNSNSSVYKVNNYSFNLGTNSNFIVYEQNGQSFLYDSTNNMQLNFAVYEGASVQDYIEQYDTMEEMLINNGLKILDAAAGTISGLDCMFISVTDGQYYYVDIFMNTNYGDVVEVLSMSTRQFEGKKVIEIAYPIISKGVKVGTAMTNASASSSKKFDIFDERLFN